MSSTFGGLELGRSALNAFRLGMQTVGHNISNMNTEGYSRQRVNYTTVTPENIYNVGQVGNGMTVSSIERIRDEFLDFQFRDMQATLGYWEKVNDLYDSIQNYISEPNSSGVRSAMDTFFTNMQALQEKPEDTSARQALVTSANSLGSMLGNLIDSFNTYNESINLEIKQSVDDANHMLHEIAALNGQIYEAETLGQNANDLRDSRDLLIDKLSKMMDISYNEPVEHNGVKGEFFLSVNGRVLVQGINVRELKAHAFMWDNQVYYDVQVAENEFDIVDDPSIAEALATGPEGSYQLAVDRIANGVEWTSGGGNAHCLETYAVKTSEFSDGIILKKDASDTSDEIPRKLSLRTLITQGKANDSSTGKPVTLTVKIDWDKDNSQWNLRAERDGTEIYSESFSDTDDDGSNIVLKAEDLTGFIDNAINTDPVWVLDGTEQGNFHITDGELDWVIIDAGSYFQVDMGNGQIGYTRAGQWKIGDDGYIVSKVGDYRLIPDIRVPDNAQSIRLSPTGVVSVRTADDTVQEIGQVTLAKFDNPSGLQAVDGINSITYPDFEATGQFLYVKTDESGEPTTGNPGSDGFPQVRQNVMERPINASDLSTSGLKAEIKDNAITFTTGEGRPLEITDYSGMLGALTEAKRELLAVNMRTEPADLNDPLNISGSFRIQVGTQGVRVTSKNFGSNPGKSLQEGEILAAIDDNDTDTPRKHTFRIGVSGNQADISATWNASTKKWVLSSDLCLSKEAGKTLTVKDLTEFMSSVIAKAGESSENQALAKLKVTSGKTSSGTVTQFYVESKEDHLISISDVEGNLAASMGMVNESPVITIDVDTSDSLVTIRNKINEKYQEEFGLTQPEQWVHASVDNGYLEISANVAGEAQRITLMGSEDGNMQVLRRLGLTANQKVDTGMRDDNGDIMYTYREVAYIPESGVAEDASFSINGIRYLSSDNMFSMARRIPATSGNIHDRYKATELTEVNPGMWLNLKSTGTTTVRVLHHIRDGSIKGLEEARDEIIPNLKSELDEMAYGLVKTLNAYQYSGYGISADENTTGVAFFNTLSQKSGAAQRLSVTDRVAYDPSLIGAAMGKKNSEGLAVSGKTGGSGDGTNASRMVNLNFGKVLEEGTMTIGGIYDAMLSHIGTEAGHAKLMYTTEATVSDQINSQRQACSGVNLDEELMDIVILNRAFGAMSRYITTMDEMLNTIINGMGLVGR